MARDASVAEARALNYRLWRRRLVAAERAASRALLALGAAGFLAGLLMLGGAL